MGYLSHPYAWRLASASFAGATIERLQYRDMLDVVIRFADWRGRRFQPKALEIGEAELLVLLGDAFAANVFSREFRDEVRYVMEAPARGQRMSGTLTVSKHDKDHAQVSVDGEYAVVATVPSTSKMPDTGQLRGESERAALQHAKAALENALREVEEALYAHRT